MGNLSKKEHNFFIPISDPSGLSNHFKIVYASILDPAHYKRLSNLYTKTKYKRFISTSFIHYLSLLDSLYKYNDISLKKVGFFTVGREGWLFYQYFHHYLKYLKKRLNINIYNIFPKYVIPNLEFKEFPNNFLYHYSLDINRTIINKKLEYFKNKNLLIGFEPSFLLGETFRNLRKISSNILNHETIILFPAVYIYKVFETHSFLDRMQAYKDLRFKALYFKEGFIEDFEGKPTIGSKALRDNLKDHSDFKKRLSFMRSLKNVYTNDDLLFLREHISRFKFRNKLLRNIKYNILSKLPKK